MKVTCLTSFTIGRVGGFCSNRTKNLILGDPLGKYLLAIRPTTIANTMLTYDITYDIISDIVLV